MIASPTRRSRSRLLATCTFAMLATPVVAQTYPDRALQGDATFNPAEVIIARTAVKDTITVRTPQAIINWNPETSNNPLPAGTINFLPNGREAVFQGAVLGQDFVVLNRILPSTNRAISINGTVTGQVITGFAPGPPPLPTYGRGGSVWFYSPGGIIAGPTSVFNVGNLILTANDIDATGGLFSPTGAIRFRSAANSVAAVTIQPGAQINLPVAGSYFGVVAPQVNMGGTATVNGSIAYAAAEQVDLELNGGFFSISFLTGTGVANALTHTGTTTGPAGNGTIAMAAMPKNTAITMLVGGTVGYTPAATATVQNGTIVLSAGQNVVFGNIGGNWSATAANLNIGSGLFRSEVNAQATNIIAAPAGGAPLTFTSNVNLASAVSTQVRVDAGQTITVGGNLLMGSGQIGQGGATGITVNDGTLAIAGQTSLNTTAFGKDDPVGTGGNATGGQSTITINGGTVTFGDALFLSADGIGGGGPALSGNGFGGTASITLNAGTTPTVLNLNGFGNQLSAIGAVGGQFPSIGGGNATGGNALLTVNSGTMNSVELTLDASATGGDATTGLAGVASGGTARVLVTGGRYNTDSLFLAARERQAGASTGGTAGATTGSGLAAVDVSGAGILSVGANGGNGMSIDADAVKAGPRLGAPAAGGAVIAGTARLTATNGGTITTDATASSGPKQPVLVTASVIFLDTILGAPTSSQRAGTVLVNADGGTMTLHRLDMRAHALARDFVIPNDRAGPSFGGSATLAARNGGSITVVAGEGVTPISAYGTGGSTNTPALGTGGTVDVLALGGTLALPDGLSVDVRGYSGTTLGGTGGTINLRSTTGAAGQAGSLTAGVTTLNASGQISAGLPNATAGAITVANIGAGQTMTFANLLARAGVSGSGAPSGSITLTADNAPIVTTVPFTGIDLGTLGTLTINAVGAAGTVTGSTGVFGYGNDILVSHTGVAPGSTSTITGPTVSLEAGRDQIHTGSVTMRGGTVTLVGRRTLGGVDSSVISTGGIELGSGLLASSNGVRFRTLDTAGLLRGYQGASSYTPEITTTGSFIVGERVFAGAGNIDIRANTGIDIADAGTSATGQVLLSSTAGDVRLGTSGIALATRPNGITLTASAGTARFTNLFSRAAINAAGANGIIGGDATANFGIQLTSATGAIAFGRTSSISATIQAATNIGFDTVAVLASADMNAANGTLTGNAVTVPSGTATLRGNTGLDIATLTTSGAASLSAPNGPVRVATNIATGAPLTVTGRSIFLRALGTFTAPSLNATAGDLDVSSVGALSITTPQATGSITLASTGSTVDFGTATAGTALNLTAAGTVTGTSATAGGAVSVTGATGITIPTLISGGPTTLSAVNGAIRVAANLQSAGLVTASGRSLFLRATGALTGGAFAATAGDVDVAAGAVLTAATVQASGDVIMGAGAVLTPGAITAGRDIVLTAQSVQAGSLTAPRDLRIVTTGMAMATGTIAAGRDLSVDAGQTNFQAVNGGSVAITSGQGVIFNTINSASTVALNAGDDAVGTGVVATGAVTTTAGRNLNFGTLQAGDNATLSAAGSLTLGTTTATNLVANATGNLTTGSVTATEDIRLFGGPGPAIMTTGDMTAGDDIIATGNAITTGNLLTTGLGPDSEDDGSAIDLQLNRIATGTANSAGRILYAASQPITFTSTTSRFGTIIRSFGPISGGNSTAGTTLDIQGGSIDTANGQAGGALNYINFAPADSIRTGTLTGATVTASSRGTLATGAVNAVGAVNLFGDLGANVASATSTGGDLQLFAQTSGPISSGALRAGGNLSVSGQAGNDVLTTLDAGGRILIGAGGGTLSFTRATAGGLVGISAGGNIGFGTLQAGGTFQMQTPGTITGTSATSAGGAPNIVQGDAGITLPTLVTNGVTALTATNGAVRIATDLRSTGAVTATGRSVFLRSTGALSFAGLNATAGALDVATAGNLSVTTGRATGDIVVTSALDLTVGTFTAGWDFEANEVLGLSNLTVGGRNVTVGTLAQAGGALSVTATGVATFNGSALSRFVTNISSADIAIGATARVGSSSSSVSLTNSGTQQTIIGGAAGTGGYRLDAAEILRLTGRGNLSITAPLVGGPAATTLNSARTPDVIVDSFTANAGSLIGGEVEGITIETPGKIRVIGAVTINGMNPGNSFGLSGGEAVEILDAGRIVLNGQSGLSGIIALTSRNIVASSSAALADFAAAADLKAISDRAAKNDGAVNDGGYLQAGTITATLLNSTLIIQNTGAATTTANRDYSGRRGFTVGAGGFTIVQAGSNPVRIAINGRQVGATTPLGAPTIGGFVTGLDLIPLIKIRGIDSQTSDIFQVPPSGVLTSAQLAAAPRLFDTTSTVNGCAITGGSGCRVQPNDPIRDILNEDFGEGSVGNLLPLALIQLKDYVTPGDEPLIDEPVTGAGNDDLWSVDDTKAKCDPAKEKCPA